MESITISLLVIAVITALLLLYHEIRYLQNYWKIRNIAHISLKESFQCAKQLIFQQRYHAVIFNEVYTKLKRKSNTAGGFLMINQPVHLIIDPDVIRDVLTKKFTHFQHRGFFVDEETDPLSAHLVALDGAKWKNLRTRLTPAFTSGKMKMMFETILNCSKQLEDTFDDHIKSDKVLDIKEIFSRLATDIIVSCAFGLECNSLQNPDNEFRKYGKMFFRFGVRETIVNFFAFNYPGVLRFFKIPQTNPEVSTFFLNILKATVDYREKNNVHRKDFLDILIRLKNKQNILDEDTDGTNHEQYSITFNELAAQAFIFFGAGFDTTSTTINFSLFELATNENIQENVRKEIKEVLEKYNGNICYDAIMEMKYMDKFLMEVLRKYPPIGTMNRVCTADYIIPGTNYQFKKDDVLIVSSYALQKDPEYFPNPDVFDPERFNDEQKAKRHPYVYLPFGEGPRVCIGKRFALLEMKITLSVIMTKYKFTVDATTELPLQFDPKTPFLTPKNNIWLRASKIN